ncbi:raffinose/stachyose/melibiose transport system permease protein [Paenibacillus algorifonticola]|uniref:Raffinose/stachyose/melibiose transport system permease protein n=1 Tax=Paenibacillus algorifonticola TaxID=684063 RepID=A0A1I2H9H9_9BACL|nr:sugar ABC transporter permease [Paenibacillus algorifonticola]SFF25990.1 raffinose/stachyose/melibiose transport system permease protein [Paenibacillus algorifonticola]
MEKALSNRWVLALFLLPGLTLFSVFFLYPVCRTVFFSLHEWDGIQPMKFIGLSNYVKMFTDDPNFYPAVQNGFVFVLFSLIFQLPAAFILAMLVSRKIKGSKWFRNVYFFPVIMSTTMVSLLWSKIYDPAIGLLNAFLRSIGLESMTQLWLGDTKTSLLSVVFVLVWQFVGYHMLIMFAGIQSIPDHIYEAARLDGATGWKSVRHITLPLLSDVLKVDVVLAVVGSLKVFEQVYVMTGGGPDNSSTVIAVRMFQEAFLKMNFGYGSTLAVYLVVQCLLISWVINKLMSRNTVYS